ncbi:hypothetical protein NKJ26_03335 [Mesorhizobium sp. M0152]|uniref:hypothetical protein n=1 Tax=Mesorhizobium sp. M0152 TaxID=2956898 RepID=UPI0033352DBA
MIRFRVNHEGFLNMTYRRKGDEVTMGKREAKYLAPPYGDRLSPVVEKKPKAARRRKAAVNE